MRANKKNRCIRQFSLELKGGFVICEKTLYQEVDLDEEKTPSFVKNKLYEILNVVHYFDVAHDKTPVNINNIEVTLINEQGEKHIVDMDLEFGQWLQFFRIDKFNWS